MLLHHSSGNGKKIHKKQNKKQREEQSVFSLSCFSFLIGSKRNEEAKKQMEPHLPTLIPKLYRSSYDPNPRLAQAMHGILAMLMDPRKAVEKYHLLAALFTLVLTASFICVGSLLRS